jgi:hypothetical protein
MVEVEVSMDELEDIAEFEVCAAATTAKAVIRNHIILVIEPKLELRELC